MEGKNVLFDESDFDASPDSDLAGKYKFDLCQNPKCAEDLEELREIRSERSVTLRVYLCFFCHFENKYRGAMRRHFRETHDMVMVETPNECRDTEEIDDREVERSVESDGANNDKLQSLPDCNTDHNHPPGKRNLKYFYIDGARRTKRIRKATNESCQSLKKMGYTQNIKVIKIKSDMAEKEEINPIPDDDIILEDQKELLQSSVNEDVKLEELKNNFPCGLNVNSDGEKEGILNQENMKMEGVLAKEEIREYLFESSAETADEASEDVKLHPMEYEESMEPSDSVTQTNVTDKEYEKVLHEGKVFHTYEELQNAIKRYEEMSNFVLCARSTTRCNDADLDRNKFPKRNSVYVCQLGQRERHRLKAGFRQRRLSDNVVEKTGCPVRLRVNLQDTGYGKGYVVTNFNQRDHNHLPTTGRRKRIFTKKCDKNIKDSCDSKGAFTKEEAAGKDNADPNDEEQMSADNDIHHSASFDESEAVKTHKKGMESDVKDEKLLFKGQFFSNFEELQKAVVMYENKYRFKLCVRDSDPYDGSDLDISQFPKRRIQYVCQLGQRARVRLKAEIRQRKSKKSVTEKTGCPVKMYAILKDLDVSKPRYLIINFNHEDHNHPPRPQPEVDSNLERPKSVKTNCEDKTKLCENCGYSTDKAVAMRAHVESQHRRKYCPIEGCDFTSLSHADLTRHMMCSADHRAVCSLCNYVPGRGKTLDDHKCEDFLGK